MFESRIKHLLKHFKYDHFKHPFSVRLLSNIRSDRVFEPVGTFNVSEDVRCY